MNVMQKMNNQTQVQLVSIHDRFSGRQANNLLDRELGETIRPWFAAEEQKKVEWALNALDRPDQRDRAAAYLGVEIVSVS